MPVVPSVPTFGPSIVPDTVLNQLADAVRFALAPPLFRGRQTSVQPLTTGTFTAITWDTEDVDSANGHDTSTNPSRYTAQYAGWYQVSGGVSFANNSTGYRQTVWGVNGSLIFDYFASMGAVNGTGTRSVARTLMVYLAIGDYVELHGWQNGSASLNTEVASGTQSSINVRWVSS